MLSLPEGDDNVATHARHTLDALDLGPVVEAQSGGQRLVIASARSPGPAKMDVIGEIVQDYGWTLLARGKPSLRVVRWPRLREFLSRKLDGQPVLVAACTCDKAKQSLLRSATARALAGALLRHHDACNDLWQDLWSQCCEGGRVPSRPVLSLKCNGCGETAPLWVHQCASIPLCGSSREHAGRGWPKARWALRHSGQLSSGAWKAIQRDLRGVQVDAVLCQMTRLQHCPCCCGGLRWTVTHEFCGSCITEEFCREATGVGGDAAGQMRRWWTGRVLPLLWTRKRWWQ